MRVFLSCLGLLILLGLAAGCIAGIVAIAIALDHTMNVPIVVPDAAPVCPDCPVTPAPDPKPEPKPDRRKPWGPRQDRPVGTVSEQLHMPRVVGSRDGSIHDGQPVQVDLPCDQLVRNCGGSDGSGLCVFTSIMFAARLQNVPQLKDFQSWMKKHPGGGWPQKVDKMIAQKCKEENKPIPDYIQVENGDWSLVELALKTGRMPAITYGAAHMTNIVCLTDKWGAFRDNNFVGEREIDWMTAEQAKQKAGGRRFWSVILLAPRPPSPPHNGKPVACSAPYAPGAYRWTRVPDCLQWALWRDGEQVGSYDGEDDFYAVRRGPGEWGPYYRRPPVDLPPETFPALAGRIPGGVFFQYEGAARYSHNGVVISKEEAFAALKLADDSKKLSLTVIGTQAEQDAVRAALVADTVLASHVVFQGYTPDDWTINTEKFGFAHDGKPTIYLQKPDGEVLLHVTDFNSKTMEQLRQKDPNYKPANDPGMPHGPDTLDANWGPLTLLACLGGVGMFLTSLLGGALAIVHHLIESLTAAPAAAEE